MTARSILYRLRQRTIARFLRQESGTAAIEFGFVAVPFIALMLAVLQVGLIYFAQEALETATEKTGRLVLTGQAPNSSSSTTAQNQAQFATDFCNNAPLLFKDANNSTCSGIMIDLQPAPALSGTSVQAPTLTYDSNGNVTNTWQYNPGNPGDIMVLRVMYQWPTVLGPLSLNFSNLPNNKRLLISTSVFKNEP